uniref:Acid ceramidase N-terminal domain-containing protein n=1 Tax=Amphimedon queenslandica TaxID=400682 RepID=A0A1X7URV2_AMPQE
MMAAVWFMILLTFSIQMQAQAKDIPIPNYNINLDLPPNERWKQVAIDYSQSLKELIDYFREIIGNNSYHMLSIMAASLERYYPQEYAQEMMSFVTYGQITVGDIVIWNMLDELTAYVHQSYPPSSHYSSSSIPFFSTDHGACTSILATTKAGKIIHGRNLDYGGPLRKLAVTVHFQRNGITVYSGTTFAGYVGILTAVKPGRFLALKVRDLLDDPSSDFEKVVDTIVNTQFIGPFYAIVGGVSGDEGAIITHNRTAGIDVWRLNSSENRWFILETNYDHWTPPPESDDRRDPANKMMNETGLSNISSDSIFKILSTPPILNDGTIFTVLMSAADPTLYTGWIRELS